MQYPSYQKAGWPIGSGSVESANKLVVEARLKGAGMRWERHNVNPMRVIRNAVCNREWKHTWETALAHRQGLRTHCRYAPSQQRLEHACWFLAVWGVRVYRLAHPSAPVPTTTTRPGSGYSWRKPFLRRLPSPPRAPVEVGAKKCNTPHLLYVVVSSAILYCTRAILLLVFKQILEGCTEYA